MEEYSFKTRKKVKSNSIKLFFLFLLIFYIFLLIFYFPMVGNEFDYYHMADAIKLNNNQKITDQQNAPGYYILITITSQITNFSYDIIPKIPFQIFPLFFLLYIFLTQITQNPSKIFLIINPIIILVFFSKGFNIVYWWLHSLGFLLIILMVVTLSIKNRNNNELKLSYFFIIIATIITLNIISYKLVFFAVCLLISFQLIQYFEVYFLKTKTHNTLNLELIITFSLVYILTFNNFFYNSFLENKRVLWEVKYSGVEKYLFFFHKDPNDVLTPFYFVSSFQSIIINIIFILCIIFCLLIMIFFILKNFLKKIPLSFPEKIFLSIILASIPLMIVYNILGFFEITFLIFLGITGYAYLYSKLGRKFNILLMIILTSLLISNYYICLDRYSNDYYSGMNTDDNCIYLKYPSNWIIICGAHEIKTEEKQIIYSDVFTGGFITKEFVLRNNNDFSVSTLSREELIAIFNNTNKNQKNSGNNFLIINEKLSSFLGANWERYNSWSKYKFNLQTNVNINKIYSSGSITIDKMIQ